MQEAAAAENAAYQAAVLEGGLEDDCARLCRPADPIEQVGVGEGTCNGTPQSEGAIREAGAAWCCQWLK